MKRVTLSRDPAVPSAKAMWVLFLIFCNAIVVITTENDKPWAWSDDKKTSRSGDARYQIHEHAEHLESFDNEGAHLGFRPHNPGPYGPSSRPLVPGHHGNGILVGPGGPTGVIGRPPRYDEPSGHDGFPVSMPPWIRDDPRYREYDTCKCRYSFNCPSPGLKFGSCSKDKKYCCFNSKRFPELSGERHYPPYHGTPHKYGPAAFTPTSNYYGNRRPHGNPYDGYQHSSFGGYNPGSYGVGYGHRNEFESVRPYGYQGESEDYEIYGRSLRKNQTQTTEKPITNETPKKE